MNLQAGRRDISIYAGPRHRWMLFARDLCGEETMSASIIPPADLIRADDVVVLGIWGTGQARRRPVDGKVATFGVCAVNTDWIAS